VSFASARAAFRSAEGWDQTPSAVLVARAAEAVLRALAGGTGDGCAPDWPLGPLWCCHFFIEIDMICDMMHHVMLGNYRGHAVARLVRLFMKRLASPFIHKILIFTFYFFVVHAH